VTRVKHWELPKEIRECPECWGTGVSYTRIGGRSQPRKCPNDCSAKIRKLNQEKHVREELDDTDYEERLRLRRLIEEGQS
jgi:hypothetical protein